METLEAFKMIRNACDEVITALENEDAKALEISLGKFMVVMLKLDALK